VTAVMLSFVAPAAGVALWVVHVRQSFTRLQGSWARLALFVGLPMVCLALPFSIGLLPGEPHQDVACGTCWDPLFVTLLANSASGLVVWVLLLILEIPLSLWVRALRRERDLREGFPESTGHEEAR